ncbi:MAG: hypothetical protein KGK14_03525, partial [Bacteroidota bacterium]|nr:hypothetical protein [Bacteroidota bacterium]
YKQIIIQDESAGIVVKLDGNNLYANFPIGRKIVIKAKGLYLGDYGGVIQIGAGIDNSDPSNPTLIPIPSALFDKYILKGSFNNEVKPKFVSINALTASLQDTLQSTLIQLSDVEFATNELNKTFADAIGKQSANLTIKNCLGNSIILRTSGYADFASFKIPSNNGYIIAVFSVFGATKQILIRDTSDVQFFKPRCENAISTKISIAAVRNNYSGYPFIYTANKFMHGIIISDANNGNIPDNEMVIQEDANASGIRIRFNSVHHFKLGDSVALQLNQSMLTKEDGVLYVTNIDTSAIVKLAESKKIVPRVVTIQQLHNNINNWESTLVQLNYPMLIGNSWNQPVQLSNGSESIYLFNYPSASYYLSSTPSLPIHKLTGILSLQQSVAVILLRSLNDIELLTGSNTQLNNAIYLTQSPLLLNFNDIANGLPTGFFVYTNAGSNNLGSNASFNTSKTSWGNTTGGFKNCASASELTSTATATQQDNNTNRAIAVRQTGTGGLDPGAAFVLHLGNTTGKKNIQLSFQLQSLDANSARTSNWAVEYGLGDNPTTFNTVIANGTLVSGNNQFGSQLIQVSFGSLLSNIPTEIWIRIVTKNATTGAGSRPLTAIDDVSLSWD